MYLRLEAAGKKAVDVVIAVVRKDESTVVDISPKMFGFLRVELNQFVAADITKWVLEDVGAIQVDNLFLQVDRERCIFNQRIQQIGGHPLVGVPVSRPIPQSCKCELFPLFHRRCNFFKVDDFIFNFLFFKYIF
jgi:hypothetical protein